MAFKSKHVEEVNNVSQAGGGQAARPRRTVVAEVTGYTLPDDNMGSQGVMHVQLKNGQAFDVQIDPRRKVAPGSREKAEDGHHGAFIDAGMEESIEPGTFVALENVTHEGGNALVTQYVNKVNNPERFIASAPVTFLSADNGDDGAKRGLDTVRVYSNRAIELGQDSEALDALIQHMDRDKESEAVRRDANDRRKGLKEHQAFPKGVQLRVVDPEGQVVEITPDIMRESNRDAGNPLLGGQIVKQTMDEFAEYVTEHYGEGYTPEAVTFTQAKASKKGLSLEQRRPRLTDIQAANEMSEQKRSAEPDDDGVVRGRMNQLCARGAVFLAPQSKKMAMVTDVVVPDQWDADAGGFRAILQPVQEQIRTADGRIPKLHPDLMPQPREAESQPQRAHGGQGRTQSGAEHAFGGNNAPANNQAANAFGGGQNQQQQAPAQATSAEQGQTQKTEARTAAQPETAAEASAPEDESPFEEQEPEANEVSAAEREAQAQQRTAPREPNTDESAFGTGPRTQPTRPAAGSMEDPFG